jgi:hypothetical protein
LEADLTDSDRAGQGSARGYSWPPFGAGNTVAEVHGARSERRIVPLADRIARELLERESTPPYLREPEFAPSVAAWSRAEAVVALLWDFLAERDIVAAMSEVSGEDETTETTGKGRSERHMKAKRITSALSELHRAETRAATLRGRLGLDPMSRAKLAADLGQARWYAGRTPLDVALDRIEAERQAAIEAGAGDG